MNSILVFMGPSPIVIARAVDVSGLMLAGGLGAVIDVTQPPVTAVARKTRRLMPPGGFLTQLSRRPFGAFSDWLKYIPASG